MSITHNGKEYGATKVINYSAAPDYNRGVTVDNIQSGNYQATDNGFLFIQLQSQQSNPTKVSVIRSKTPITDTGTEIASIVLSQYQYSETLTAQVMAREYYKLTIDGAGNPQVISCMFYPYATNVPIKLTEDITMEQVVGLESELAGKQDAGDYATNTALNNGLAGKQNKGDYATSNELTQGLAGKQDKGNYFNKDRDKINLAKQVTGTLGANNIADNAITSGKIADGTIKNADIADATITGAKLVNKTITAKQIADNTITANQLAPNSVGRDELGVTYAKGVSYTDIYDLFTVFGLQKPVTTAQLVKKMSTNMIGSRKALFQTGYVGNDYISDLPVSPAFITIIYLDGNGLVLEARAPFGNKALWVGATNGNNFTGWTKVRGEDGLIYPDSINMGKLMGRMFRIGGITAGNTSGIGSWGLMDGNEAFQKNGSYFNIRWTKNDPNYNAPTFVWVNDGGTVPSNSSDRILACKLQ